MAAKINWHRYGTVITSCTVTLCILFSWLQVLDYFPVSKSVQVSKPTSILVSSKLQVAIEHSTSLVVLALKMAVWYSGLSHRRSFFTLSCAQLVGYWDGWPPPTRQTVSVFNQPPILRWKMSISQNAMLLCGWKVKVGWLQGRSHTSGVRGVRTPCQENTFLVCDFSVL